MIVFVQSIEHLTTKKAIMKNKSDKSNCFFILKYYIQNGGPYYGLKKINGILLTYTDNNLTLGGAVESIR